MASAAVDCRPLRDTNSQQPTLAAVRTAPDPVSSPTAAAAAAAGQPRTPGGSRRVVFHGQLYGAEAVGRKCAVLASRNGGKAWDKATVVEFNPTAGQHKLRYSASKQEEWANLADLRFKWSQLLPPNTPPNPTHKPECGGEAAVGKRLRVYWPAMQKWYQGSVKSYDARADKHLVCYKDGDTQALVLRHEPVIWADDEPGSINGTSSGEQLPATTPRHSTSVASTLRLRPASAAAAAPAAAVPAPAAAVAERPALRSRSPAVRGPSAAALEARRLLGAAFAALPSARTSAGQQQQSLLPPAPAAGAGTKLAAGKAAAGSHAAGAGPTRASGGGSRGPGSAIAARAAAATAAAAAAAAGDRTATDRTATRAGPAPKAAAGANPVNGALHLQKTGPGARTPGAAVAAAGGSNQRSDAAQQRQRRASDPGDSRQQQRQQQLRAGTALGKHARERGGQDSQSKRARRSSHPVARSGSGVVAAGGPAAAVAGRAGSGAIQDKHLAVGCRVSVWWRLDRLYYKGKLTSYAPSSGKYTIKYDDGQSEAVQLERERFMWHSPRAASAGYRPALHTLMRQLGADGLQPMPEDGPDGRAVPVTPGPENAPHPPMSGAGAVGWRIKLYWPADRGWHEAEVLSYDEGRHKHHLLYLDGEEEWADLARENVRWLKATRHGAISAGAITGDDLPKGRDAVGWRIAVYWKDDRTFYDGEVRDYEASTGRHKVLYSDGEEEWLHLRNERVIWRLPPSDESDSEASGDDSDADVSLSGEETPDSEDIEEGDEDDEEEEEDEDDELSRRARDRGRLKALRGRTRGRARAGGGRRRARRAGPDSDSGSASGAAAAAGDEDYAAGASAGGFGGGAEAAAGGAAGGDGDARAGQQLLSGQLGSGGAGERLGSHLRFGGRAGTAGNGRAGQAGRGSMGGKGSLLQRQGPSGLAGARGSGGSFGGCGPLNLPPLQVLRRASADGVGPLGSPLRPIQLAEQLQLVVKIVPGAGAGVAAGGASRAAAAAGTRSVSAVTGVVSTGAGGNGAAAAAASSAGTALKPLLQKLPVRQQRVAARLQRKMDRLHLILGKLSSTAGALGWKLERLQLPAASPRLLAAAAAAAQQLQGAADTPMSPTAAAARKRAGGDPTLPRAVKAARSQAPAAAAALAGGGSGSLPVSPRGPASPTPCSPTAAAAAGRSVPVVKTCAVKSKPGQSNSSGQRLRLCSPSSTPTHATSSSAGGQLASPRAREEAAAAAAAAPAAAADAAPAGAAPAEAAAAQPAAAAAADVGAAVSDSAASTQQPLADGPAAKAAEAAVPSAAAQHSGAAAAAAAAATVHLAKTGEVRQPPSPQQQQQQQSQPTASSNGSAQPAAATTSPQTAAAPARQLPQLPAASALDVSYPAAPSASLTADDVVLKLQAIAAAQNGSSGGALQQHLNQHAAAAASAAPAGSGNSPATGSGGGATGTAPMDTD